MLNNQSDLDDFRASDLQIASVELSTSAGGVTTGSATMQHKMGLASIKLNYKTAYNTKYYIALPAAVTDENYTWYSSATTNIYASTNYNSSSVTPYQPSATQHYYITNATGTTAFSTNGTIAATADSQNSWSASITNSTIAGGGYTELTKTPTTTYLVRSAYTLALGDVFYSDGSISKPGLTNLYAGKTPIGVVVFIPANSTEKQWAEPSHNGGHALVMALKNSVSGQVLYDNTVSGGYPAYSGKYKTSATTPVAYSDWGNDKSGYVNTNAYLSTTGSPAGYNALHHSPAGPSTSSGWFLPTVGQWIYVLAPRAGLTPTNCSISSWTDTGNKAITALNGYLSSSGASYTSLNIDTNGTSYYWPNTNWLNGTTVGVWNIRFTNNSIVFNGESNKTDGDHLGYVRPFLAF